MPALRKQISKLFQKLKFKNFTVFWISSLPFILIEENVNCLLSGCMIVPPTVPILLIFIVLLGFIVRSTKPKGIFWPVMWFSLFGAIFEFSVGGAHVELQALPILFMSFMFFFVWVSYAYLAVVPLHILLNPKKKK